MKTQKLRINSDYHLSDLVNEIEKGDLRLPRFQRDYVWNRTKVIGLLDSIYNEFPIGSFFIWHADSQYRSLYKNIAELDLPEPKDERQLRYILDGQQRATSLYVAIKGLTINGTDYGRICFDLENEEFVYRPANGKSLIALRDILDRDRSLRLSREIPEEHFETFQRCSNLFQQYPLSVVSVQDMELGNAIEIFERINKGGVRLSMFDLVVASTWSETFDLKANFEKLRDDLKNDNFGSINPEIVSHSAALILKKYCTRSQQLSIKSKELEDNWKEIDTAIRQAVVYLRSNLGVYTIEFMPYPSMIALVAYAFFNSNGRSLSADMERTIKEWFWKSALTERYSATLEGKLGEDRRDIFDKVLAGEEPIIGMATLNEDRIRSMAISAKSAIRNAFFCMLALQHPRHFKTGAHFPIVEVLTSYGAIEKHHVFPRAYLRDNNLDSENLIANFCFIPAELNKEITNKAPSDYFKLYNQLNPDFDEVLTTHLLTYSDAIRANDYHAFLEERSKLIFEQFKLLVGSKILRDLDGNANAVIDEVELAIRQLISRTLISRWESAIPAKQQTKIHERLESEEKNTATTNAHITPLEELKQLDIADYAKIIEVNWKAFEEVFEEMAIMKSRMSALRRFRNDIKHSKDMDEITQREGEAAIAWLSRCLHMQLKPQILNPAQLKDEVFYLEGSNISAQAKLIGNRKILVMAGSKAAVKEATSFEGWSQNARQRFVKEGLFKLVGSDTYELTKDATFDSPSAASSTMCGRSTNGWTAWKTKDGMTLREASHAPANNLERS